MEQATATTAVTRVGIPGRVAGLAGRAWEWLASAPISTAIALVIVVVGIAGAVTGRGWLDALAVQPDDPARVWTVITSLVWTRTLESALGEALLTVVVGAWVERFLGRRRYLAAGLAASVVGMWGLQALYPLILLLERPWGDHLAQSLCGGPLGIVLGALAAASVRMDPVWRRRVLTWVFVWLSALVAFGGGADDIAQLVSSLAGLVGGLLVWRGQAPQRSLVGTRHDARTIVALVVLAVSAGTLLSGWAAFPVGPLAAARFGLQPGFFDPATINTLCADPNRAAECAQATWEVRSRGIGATLLAALPILVQIVLAEGLRIGRRAAAIGTIVLQCGMALIATLHLLVARWLVSYADDRGPLGFAADGTPTARLIVPLVVPLLLAVQVALHLRCFRVRAEPGTFSRFWLRAGAVVLAGLVVVESVGMLIADDFVPSASPGALAEDHLVRLLPSAALALLSPTLEPNTAVATALVEWTPIGVWAAVGVLLWRALRADPFTRPGERELLADVVRRRGGGSLGWMLTWPGNDVWLDAEARSAWAYRTGSGVALTVTEPAAAPDDLRRTIVEFSHFCTSHSLVPALYSVHAPVAQAAQELGWATVRVAEEAVIDLPGVEFKGKAFQDVRTALNRADKEGIRMMWTTYSAATPGIQDQIRAICEAWLTDKALPEMGFTLGGVAELDDETRVALAVDAEGTVHGVTSWLPVHRDGVVVGLTLDVMRRREGGFRSTMEFLIAQAVLDAKAEGLAFVSLSGSPLARTAEAGDDPHVSSSSRVDGVLDVLGALLEPVYGFRSLLAFKAKFGPRFVPLYLAVPDLVDAPAVGLAIARAYLPNLGAADAARFAQRLVSRD